MLKKVFFVLSLATLLLSSQNPALAALRESNTVPSNQMITDLAVIKTGGENGVVVRALLMKVPEKEADGGPSLLMISANETITFSVGDTAVVCKQDQNCPLPYVKDAPYKVVFKRFNGEVIQSLAKLPDETNILTPVENSHFGKNEVIHFSWTPNHAQARGIALSSFLNGRNCDTRGTVDWNTDFTAIVPKGFVGSCDGPVKARFTVFYMNPYRVRGVAGGTFKAYSMANLHFTYLDNSNFNAELSLLAAEPSSAAELPQILSEIQTQPEFGETILR